MPTPASTSRLRWRRPQGWGALVLGLGALVAALAVAIVTRRPVVPRFTITAGDPGTTRSRVADALVDAARARGADARLVSAPEAADELAAVNAGTIDFALVSGAYHFGPHDHVREVGPLYLEALHLAVRADLVDAVTHDLGTLRGHSVDLGPRGSETEGLARLVLAFAQLAGSSPDIEPLATSNLENAELRTRLDAGDYDALPDAVFQLAIIPSQLILPFVRQAGYRLVPLPFADAMRLNALAGDITIREHAVDLQYVTDAVVPAFTYMTRPPVPAAPLVTVGARLLIVANERVPDSTVGFVLDAAFRSRFARIADPPLDPSVLAQPPRLPLHAGTLAFIRRNQPLITADNVDAMSNLLSIVGALVGGAIFLFQWRRQRAASQRDQLFGSYIARVADIERRTSALELSAVLDLQQLIGLQREALELKSEALDRFAAGDLGDRTTLSELLAPVDGARDHIGELILHVRESLEEKAEAQGRSEQAVWRDATKTPGGVKNEP